MNTLQSRTRLIVWIVIIVVIAGILVFFWMHGSGSPAAGTAGTNNTSSAGAESGALTTVTSTPTGGGAEPSAGAAAGSGSKSGSSAGTNPSIITINLVTPISGAAWTIGQPNVIAWSQAANVTGEIDLVNAQTKALVGVILSETGPNQTSYSWDARSIYAARYSAEQHDVVPGTYAIRIRFDGNGFGSLISGPITVTK